MLMSVGRHHGKLTVNFSSKQSDSNDKAFYLLTQAFVVYHHYYYYYYYCTLWYCSAFHQRTLLFWPKIQGAASSWNINQELKVAQWWLHFHLSKVPGRLCQQMEQLCLFWFLFFLWFCSFFSTGYHLPHHGLTRPSPHIGPPVPLKEQLLIHQ